MTTIHPFPRVRIPGQARRRTPARALFALVLLAAAAPARGVWLDVPIHVDNPFLKHLLESRVYTEPDGAAEVWNDGSGCNYLRLTNPRVSSRGGTMVVLSDGEGRIGRRIGDSCLLLQDWTGIIEIVQKPVLTADGRRLAFEVVDSVIYEADGLTGIRNETVWRWVKDHAHPLIQSIDVDLNEAVGEIETILPLFLPDSDFVRVQRLLDSLRLAAPAVVPAGIEARVNFELLDAVGVPERVPEPELSAAELEQWDKRWQTWDAFLTLLITRIAEAPGNEDLNEALLDILITSRYELTAVLARPVSLDPDPVRTLFVKSWRRVRPMVRRLSDQLPGSEALRFLGLITAADALEALDEAGPGIGLEISVSGLRRMARLIEPDAEALEYLRDADPKLRELFEFNAPPPEPGPGEGPGPIGEPANGTDPDAAPGAAEPETGPGEAPGSNGPVSDPGTGALLDLIIRPAGAISDGGMLLGVLLNQWVPDRRNINEYIPKANELLIDVADHVAAGGELPEAYLEMFRDLMRATAWKESCWRQYHVVDGTVDVLRSTAGALGIMQVLPTVWRGFYNIDSLETSIAYNASAGGEILLRYLVRYAIRKQEHNHKGGADNLVKATYAAYNGGPSHLSRYRRGDTPKSLRSIDASFFQKYRAIRSGRIQDVASCFPGFVESHRPS